MSAGKNPSSAEAWIRDFAADANQELMRKRPRVDEGAESSPSPSLDSVVVEEVESTSLGTSFENAIELCDDSNMDLFTVPFVLFNSDQSPIQQLDRLWRRINTGHFIEPQVIENLAVWMQEHLFTITTDWHALYLQEADFISRLGQTIYLLLSREDDIIDRPPSPLSAFKTHEAVRSLYASCTELCIRILQCLLDIVKSTISRRDSVSAASIPRQPIQLLSWIQILAQIVAFRNVPASTCFKRVLSFDPILTAESCRLIICQLPGAKTAVIELFERLSRAHTHVANSWETIDALLALFQHEDLGFGDQLEVVLDIAQFHILPAICEKHPKALPESFHEHFINSTAQAIQNFIFNTRPENVAATYERFVKSEDNAVSTEPAEADPVAALLASPLDNDREIQAVLVATSWALHAFKRFIVSDIMDVRSQGISLLSVQLVHLHDRYCAVHERNNHPVLQYTAKFMRASELTKYIFGPNSHASLVSHSQNIIGFLAATGTYTTLETEIIWHACTTSVEAEFVRASFCVLISLYQWLDMDNLLFIAQKYSTTPRSKISRDASDSLFQLLKKMSEMAARSHDQRDRLAPPLTCINVLKNFNKSTHGVCVEPLAQALMNELVNFWKYNATKDDIDKISDVLVSDVVNQTECATTSIELLHILQRIHPGAAEALGTKLPMAALSSELAHYVDNLPKSQNHSNDAAIPAIGVRIHVILRLLSVQTNTLAASNEQIMNTFYDYVVGNKAISYNSRDNAWATFYHIASSEDASTMAAKIVHDFVVERSMSLPPEHIPHHLVSMWNQELAIMVRTEAEKGTSTGFLSMPLWQKLVDTAEGPVPLNSRRVALENVCGNLFLNPLWAPTASPDMRYDSEFTCRQIDRLCSKHQTHANTDQDYSQVLRGIDLLDHVLCSSRDASSLDRSREPLLVDLTGNNEDGDSTRTVHLNILHEPTQKAELRILRTTTIDDLASRLPEVTGSIEHEVKISHRSIDLQAEGSQAIADLFAQTPRVLDVLPKRSPSNVKKPRVVPNRVESEISKHFDRLTPLLSGPEQLAERMYNFLSKVSPPSSIRKRYASSDVTVDDLFPSSHIWQSIYSIFVLKSHLIDSAAPSQDNRPLLAQAIRLLDQFLIDKTRAVRPGLHNRAMDCLIVLADKFAHLSRAGNETLTFDGSISLIEDPQAFVSRMIDFCMNATQVSNESVPTRSSIATFAFKCLSTLSRVQRSVWTTFINDSHFAEVHVRLLLSNDQSLSQTIASIIVNGIDDAPADAAELYMNMLVGVLSQAVQCGYNAVCFFGVTVDMVLANKEIKSNEAKTRTLTQDIVTQLWRYDHTESVDTPLPDPVMTGLLNLLAIVLEILQSHGKPLSQKALSTSIFQRLLFPPLNGMNSRPLVDPQTRSLAYKLVMMTSESTKDSTRLLDGALVALAESSHDPTSVYPGRSCWLRPIWKCSGLTNLGMTCYMNSLLQQLFANIQFRKFVFETPVVDENKQSFLVEVQKLFSRMQDEYSTVSDTRNLAFNLDIQTENQEDVHGFYEDFLSKLETNMPNEESKSRLSQFFTGKLISQIKGECGHVSPVAEPFIDLSIVVRNKASLQDSLDEYVQGEPMEGTNKYRCQACDPEGKGRLVNAMKRACLEELPDNITFCLKRFTFEAMAGLEGKVNDRFEFPQTIDLSRYLRTHLENPDTETAPDVFELVGVIVHHGTLTMGHYWSYTLARGPPTPNHRNWMRLEDGAVTLVTGGISEVQQESMGGHMLTNGGIRPDNAYVLFYQRKSVLDGKSAVTNEPGFDPLTRRMLPSKVATPASMQTQIHETNDWRQRVAHVFDDDFTCLVEWLMQRLQREVSLKVTDDREKSSETESSSPETPKEPSEEFPVGYLIEKISKLGMRYILWVALCDPKTTQKLRVPLDILHAVLDMQPDIAAQMLEPVLRSSSHDSLPFLAMMRHASEPVRNELLNFVLKCMACLRDQNPNSYAAALEDIQQVIRKLRISLPDLNLVKWPSYFDFVVRLALEGPEETKAILDTDLLSWAFKMLGLLHGNIINRRDFPWQEVIQSNPTRVSDLYRLIVGLLSSHVNLSCWDNYEKFHFVRDNGVVLKVHEYDFLSSVSEGRFSWILQSRFAEVTAHWKDFAPGKLLTLIMTDTRLRNIARNLEQYLVTHNLNEEQNLPAILRLTLCFAAGCACDQDAAKVFNALVKTFKEWDGAAEILAFMHNAHELVPWTTVQSINLNQWCLDFLLDKPKKMQLETKEWLQLCVFSPSPISDNAKLDACRVRQTRTLVGLCTHRVREAYHGEAAKAKYEALVGVLNSAATYLKKFHDSYRAHVDDEDESMRAKIGPGLDVEFEESKGTLNGLLEFLEEVNEWVSSDDGNMVSSPTDRVRRSLETGSEDAETSEDEEDSGT